MAFCKYCGKQLSDGEICGCQGSQQANVNNGGVNLNKPEDNSANMAQQNNTMNNGMSNNGMNMNNAQSNVQNQFNAEQMQQYVQQGREVATNTWKNLLEIFKAPARAGRQYAEKADMVAALVLVALQAVVAGLFGLIVMLKLNSLVSSALSLFTYGSSKIKFSGIKGFFFTLLFSAIFSAVYVLIVFVAGKIVKANIDIKKALSITSIRSAAVIPFMVVGCVLALVNPVYGMLVFFLGNILAICFVYASMTGFIEENKLCYVIAVITVVFLIITLFVMGKAVGLYMPSGMSSLSSMMNYMF